MKSRGVYFPKWKFKNDYGDQCNRAYSLCLSLNKCKTFLKWNKVSDLK